MELGLNMRENRLTLIKAQLDVLVFADMLSEPMSTSSASRGSRRSGLFWGNPLTTGVVDHFCERIAWSTLTVRWRETSGASRSCY